MVRADKPEKLIQWLRENYQVEESYPGIYYIEQAGLFAAQLIVSDELPEQDAAWLQSLTNRLQAIDVENLLANIEKNRYPVNSGRPERQRTNCQRWGCL